MFSTWDWWRVLVSYSTCGHGRLEFCVRACVYVCVWSSLCSPTASAAVINSGNIWCSVRLSECVFVYVAQFTSGLLLLFIVYRVFQGCALEGPCTVMFYGLNKKTPFQINGQAHLMTLCVANLSSFIISIRSMIKYVYRWGGVLDLHRSSIFYIVTYSIKSPSRAPWHITASPLKGLPHYLRSTLVWNVFIPYIYCFNCGAQ